ncbi:MAG: glycosyltransferase [Fimbriimonadaceae bacterium]
MLPVVLVALYGLLFSVALLNWIALRPVRGRGAQAADAPPRVDVLVPARDEAANLARLVPALVGQGFRVFVFDDESTDGTGETAARLGATVVRPDQPLPKGWTGKNRACHELARAASEASDADWWLFLDADVHPGPDFAAAVGELGRAARPGVAAITGFLRAEPGAGLEPIHTGWVWWILLATNPFALVRWTGKGHNRFLNGQFTMWRPRVYTDLWPNQAMRNRILEDVHMGRLLARNGRPVLVANLSRAAGVRMYADLRSSLDGMAKNSYEIAGSVPGSIALAGFFAVAAVGWVAAGPMAPVALGLLLGSKLLTDLTVRAPAWAWPAAPLTCALGAFSVLRSTLWHRRGTVRWKGREYPSDF